MIPIPTDDTGQETRKPKKSTVRGSKTSKTAHVLGLLTNTAPEEPVEAYSPVSSAVPTAPVIPTVPTTPAASIPFIAPLPPPVAEVQIDDKMIEAQIRSALEEELNVVEQEFAWAAEQELENPPATPEPPMEGPETAPEVRRPEPEMPLEDRSDFSQMPQREDLAIKSGDPDVLCFNIMKALVEAKADKYIRLFGLCTCERCRIDVIALSLSNLPAKYVVVHSKDIVPLLSTYEARYNAAIVSQVMSACKQVMKHPRHNQ